MLFPRLRRPVIHEWGRLAEFIGTAFRVPRDAATGYISCRPLVEAVAEQPARKGQTRHADHGHGPILRPQQ